jgi:hypothetical protein
MPLSSGLMGLYYSRPLCLVDDHASNRLWHRSTRHNTFVLSGEYGDSTRFETRRQSTSNMHEIGSTPVAGGMTQKETKAALSRSKARVTISQRE